jgi:predicted membrane chloride channel (bestrophin family)
MVVQYPSGAIGSAKSFFTVTPRMIFRLHGSAVRHVLPQCLIAQIVAYIAYMNNDTVTEFLDATKVDMGVVGFLVTFLLVFKTQTSNKEFWDATAQVEGLLTTNRMLARGICGMFRWETPEARGLIRRFLRYQTLYFFVVIEHFLRNPKGEETEPPEQLNLLRSDIETYCMDDEFQSLYPGTKRGTPGSEAEQRTANPVIVLYWMQLILRKAVEDSLIMANPVLGVMMNGVSQLEKHFYSMEKIDKLQFPFPYAQVVKILVVVYVFVFPFTIAKACGLLTMPITLLVSIGFFGLDAVAEILESPFSTDPNAINLRDFTDNLMRDIDIMFYHHEAMMSIALKEGFENEEKMSLLDRSANAQQPKEVIEDTLAYAI